MGYGLVVVGASLGGLKAVGTVLAGLPADFRLPVAVVQHRSPEVGDTLRFVLQDRCALQVREAEDKLAIAAGAVYLAPTGYHLLVEDEHFTLSTEGPVSYAQPSIDVLFETAAESYGRRLVAVVLSGTGRDGAAGLAEVSRRGGVAVVEAARTARSPEMPEAAWEAAPGALSLGIDRIAPCLVELARKP